MPAMRKVCGSPRVATVDEPRCPSCGECRRDLIEKISRPLWAHTKAELWFCAVCAKTFVLGRSEVH
jgi:hypothetical protein